MGRRQEDEDDDFEGSVAAKPPERPPSPPPPAAAAALESALLDEEEQKQRTLSQRSDSAEIIAGNVNRISDNVYEEEKVEEDDESSSFALSAQPGAYNVEGAMPPSDGTVQYSMAPVDPEVHATTNQEERSHNDSHSNLVVAELAPTTVEGIAVQVSTTPQKQPSEAGAEATSSSVAATTRSSWSKPMVLLLSVLVAIFIGIIVLIAVVVGNGKDNEKNVNDVLTEASVTATTELPTSKTNSLFSPSPSSMLPVESVSPTTAQAESSPEPTIAEPTTEPTAEPTSVDPTNQPTPRPTTSDPTNQPTPRPTTADPTNEPSQEPTTADPTSGPTSTPTAVEQVTPVNDLCENATPIFADTSLYTGATDSATITIVSSADKDCEILAADVWFAIEGSGDLMMASLCNLGTDFDTYLSIFSSLDGDCFNGFSQCLMDDDGGCGVTSEITWLTEVGATYYVRVAGFGVNTGNYALRIETATASPSLRPTLTPTPRPTPNPTPVPTPSPSPQPSQRPTPRPTLPPTRRPTPNPTPRPTPMTTLFVPEDPQDCCGNPSLPGCTTKTSYLGCENAIELNGKYYRTLHCHDPCDMVVDCDQDSDALPAGWSIAPSGTDTVYVGSSYSWGTHVVVFGPVGGPGSSGTTNINTQLYSGSGSWFVEEPTSPGLYKPPGCSMRILLIASEPPENDFCENAIELIADGSVHTGSTNSATVSSIVCGRSTPDVWFFVDGTGADMRASLCNSATDFDTYLSVFSSADGDCGTGFGDQCLTNDDGGCGLTSEIEWSTVAGVTYYLRVHSFSSTTGNFGLRVEGVEDLDTLIDRATTLLSSYILDIPSSTVQQEALDWLVDNDGEGLITSQNSDRLLDRYVMAILYLSTNGDEWTTNTRWLSQDSICNWVPSSCSADGRADQILLHENNLEGTIPTEIGMLTELTYIESNTNNLQGTIPTEVGMLTAVTHLTLSRNELVGTIPLELGRLSALRNLYLYSNNLTGSIPLELQSFLSSLSTCHIGCNDPGLSGIPDNCNSCL